MSPHDQQPGPTDRHAGPTPAWHAVEPPAPAQPRSPSPVPEIVTVLSGVLLAVLLGLVVNARVGALTIAATLAAAAVWRATSRNGPAGLAIRSQGFDVFLYCVGAVAIAVLAFTAPGLS